MSILKASSTFIPGNTRAVISEYASKIKAAVERSQDIVKQEAERLVPVDTGELALSITAAPIVDDGQTYSGLVIATADHAAYVEFGTGARGAASEGAGDVPYNRNWPGMPAQPYLRPALDYARKQILEEFSR